MIKKSILTTFGIILSFAVAIGGWVLTSYLIEVRSDGLLSATLNIATNALESMPVITVSAAPDSDGAEGGYPVFRPYNLTGDEIVSILRNWSSESRETPHEPTGEQLNMEQAIETAKEWLYFIGDLNIIPDNSLLFVNASAYLAQKLPSPGAAFLPPAYSYWAVVFTNETTRVDMLINAVTGEVWITLIYGNLPWRDVFMQDVYITESDVTNALSAFTKTLAIDFDEGGVSDEVMREIDDQIAVPGLMGIAESLTATHSFADGNAHAVVTATVVPAEDGRLNVTRFGLHLRGW